jgi:hypothetical protein
MHGCGGQAGTGTITRCKTPQFLKRGCSMIGTLFSVVFSMSCSALTSKYFGARLKRVKQAAALADGALKQFLGGGRSQQDTD